MKKLLLLAVAGLLSTAAFAQGTRFLGCTIDSGWQNTGPAMFYQYALFGSQASAAGAGRGIAFGGRFELGFGGNELKVEEGKLFKSFVVGKGNIEAGYGKPKPASTGEYSYSSNWVPYELSLGFAAGLQFRKEIAIGVEYDFIGLYGYSSGGFGGSGFRLKARYDHVTVGIGHEGDGLLTGALQRDKFYADHVEAKVDIYGPFGIGFRHTWLPDKTYKLGENRILLGMVF